MLGASYSPDDNQDDNGAVDRNDDVSDGIMVGANYMRDFGDARVVLSGGYGTFLESEDGDDEPMANSAGLIVGYKGFSAGASFASAEDSGRNDGDGWLVGVAYETGPLGVSFSYFSGEREGEAGSTDPSRAQAEQDSFQLAGEYSLGPGVAASATLGYTEFSSDTDGVGDVEGTYLITGMHLRF
jgi:hypothetical protein